MSKPTDPQIIHNALVNYIDKTRILYKDKAPFTFMNLVPYTEEEKIAIAWRQGMQDALRLINREFINPNDNYKSIEHNDVIMRYYSKEDKPVGAGQWMMAVPESLKEAAEKIVSPHSVSVVGEDVPNILIQVTPGLYLTPEEHQGNLDYDAMRDDELQEKLDNETPNDNPVY